MSGNEQGYRSPIEHLSDELEWVRSLIKRLVMKKWARGELGTRGLTVSDDEVLTFIGEDLHLGAGHEEEPGGGAARDRAETIEGVLPLVEAEISSRRRAIEARVAASTVDLPLVALAERFGLGPREREIVSVLLAPEIDPRFERVFSYSWNDFTRKRPTVGFLLELLGENLATMEAYRVLLEQDAPLRRSGVVLISGPPDHLMEGFLGRTILLFPRIVDFIRGRDVPDETVTRFGDRVTPKVSLHDLVMDEAIKAQAMAQARAAEDRPGGSLTLLWGPRRSGKRSLVAAVARELGRDLWHLDLGALFSDRERLPVRLWTLLREATLDAAVTLVDCSEDVPAEEVPWGLSVEIAKVLASARGPVFVTAPHRLGWLLKAVPHMMELKLPLPSPAQRLQVLTKSLSGPLADGIQPHVEEAADRFGLTAGALVRAATKARALADARGPGSPITREDIHTACREELAHRLGTMADQIQSTFTWDDVVLPEETMESLRELLAYARNRRFVMDKWGFRDLVPYGSGLSVLFTGPPGTGKTMVAGILAKELGMPLFKVDLSRIIDKYVGETEKKLGRIFDEAQQSHAILLFDEADSLFAKRTGVHSSIDRYANLEVNFLLQRMESFDGVTILTTNLEKNLDEAFKRRLRFHISFPFPDEDARAELWEKMLPRDAQVDDDLDFDELAEYELTGAHIKNAVLRAAMLAADQGRGITLEDLHESAARESAGMGKLVRQE